MISATVTTSEQSHNCYSSRTRTSSAGYIWRLPHCHGGRSKSGSSSYLLISSGAQLFLCRQEWRNDSLLLTFDSRPCRRLFVQTWLLEHRGANIIREPPLSTLSLKSSSMSILTYRPHVTDGAQPLTQETKGSPGVRCWGQRLPPGNPQGAWANREHSSWLGWPTLCRTHSDKFVARQAINSREEPLEKRKGEI